MSKAKARQLWSELCSNLEKAFMIRLSLPDWMVDDFEPTADYLLLGTSHFAKHGIFDPISAYGLEFGRRSEDSGLPAISLKEYVERWPHKPNFFQYYERSNGYRNFIGILLRTKNLFFSLQFTASNISPFYLNCLQNLIFNKLRDDYLPSIHKTIVVFSEYRRHAYIASSDKTIWNTNASTEGILLPLPEDFGIVANLSAIFDAPNSSWNEVFNDQMKDVDLRDLGELPFMEFMRDCVSYYHKEHTSDY